MKALRSLPLLLLALPAWGQEVKGPDVERARGILTLGFTVPKDTVSGVLTRGEASVPVAVDATRGQAQLRTARLLLAGRYELRLRRKGGETRFPFQLGDAAEVTAAQKRMETWYAGATATFRELTATLERRGAFHHARAVADEEVRPAEEERFKGFLLEWEYSLRMARMDLATYQRRLLLPPKPEIAGDLLKLVDLLGERAAAWSSALEPFGKAPGDLAAVEAAAARVLAAQGRDASELADWRGGPTREPPPTAKPGALHVSPRGFQVQIPEGAKILPSNDPSTRLEFAVDGMQVVVYVLERPSARTPQELARRVEVDAWERWDSYKRLTGEALEDRGYKLIFTAEFRGLRVRSRQTTLWPKQGRRFVSLMIFGGGTGDSWPPSVEAIESSFTLTDGGP